MSSSSRRSSTPRCARRVGDGLQLPQLVERFVRGSLPADQGHTLAGTVERSRKRPSMSMTMIPPTHPVRREKTQLPRRGGAPLVCAEPANTDYQSAALPSCSKTGRSFNVTTLPLKPD